MKKYTIYTYQPAGFSAGWLEAQADTIPAGAVSVSVWERWEADTALVYAVENKPEGI